MRPRPGTCPSLSLPSLHPLQLRRLIDLHDTIDLSVRMLVVLSRILLLTLHVHGRDAEELRLRTREADLGAPILGAVHFDGGAPAFVVEDAGADVLAKVVVDGGAGAVVGVEVCFEVVAWCALQVLGGEELGLLVCSQVLDFCEELFASVDEEFCCWVFV